MKNKVPPPVYLLIAGALMWLVSLSRYDLSMSIPFAATLSHALISTGAAIALIAVWQFRRARTTIDPLNPDKASSLVSNGIFQFSRNPMYLGMATILLGVEIKLGSLFGLIILGLFVVVITYVQIKPEERALSILFGDSFTDYCQKVRRWM